MSGRGAVALFIISAGLLAGTIWYVWTEVSAEMDRPPKPYVTQPSARP